MLLTTSRNSQKWLISKLSPLKHTSIFPISEIGVHIHVIMSIEAAVLSDDVAERLENTLRNVGPGVRHGFLFVCLLFNAHRYGGQKKFNFTV